MSSGFERKPGRNSLIRQTFEVDDATVPATPGKRMFTEQLPGQEISALVQRQSIAGPPKEAGAENATARVHAAAAQGVAGPGGGLPHLDLIQRAFGPQHDLSSVQAHIGGDAAAACDEISANAYATSNHVAFRDAADLHTAAHEVTHVIQQRSGVHLLGALAWRTIHTNGRPTR